MIHIAQNSGGNSAYAFYSARTEKNIEYWNKNKKAKVHRKYVMSITSKCCCLQRSQSTRILLPKPTKIPLSLIKIITIAPLQYLYDPLENILLPHDKRTNSTTIIIILKRMSYHFKAKQESTNCLPVW